MKWVDLGVVPSQWKTSNCRMYCLQCERVINTSKTLLNCIFLGLCSHMLFSVCNHDSVCFYVELMSFIINIELENMWQPTSLGSAS